MYCCALEATRRSLISCLHVLLSPRSAQWLHYPTPGIPRIRDGKANFSAPTPKTTDAKPDPSGLYESDNGDCFKNIAADFKARDFPIQPWAAALAKECDQSNRKDDPSPFPESTRAITHSRF